MNYIFDLDGTLLNVQKRYYALYCDCIIKQGGIPLPQQKYWKYKRAEIPPAHFLSFSGNIDEHQYREDFKSRTETPPYLALDELFPSTLRILKSLHSNHTLILITMRRNTETCKAQLATLGLDAFFTAVHTRGNKLVPKHELAAPYQGSEGIVIGDTEEDIAMGKALGWQTIAMTSGIRTASFLKSHAPTYIFKSLSQIPH